MMHTNDVQTVHTCQTRSGCKPRPSAYIQGPACIQGPASISTITSDPRPVFEAGLVFKEIWYARKMLWTIGNGECELMMLCNSHEDRVRVT